MVKHKIAFIIKPNAVSKDWDGVLKLIFHLKLLRTMMLKKMETGNFLREGKENLVFEIGNMMK
jgi:hypothetical protein